MRDFYEVLGVARDADDATLKSAFRKLAMEHHPDKNGGCPDATARFKEINEAYSVLSDPQKRAAYDRYGHAGLNGMNGGGGGGSPTSTISSTASSGTASATSSERGQRSNNGPARGQDLRYDYEITLEQAYSGAEVEIKVPAAMACEACAGSGASTGTSPTTVRRPAAARAGAPQPGLLPAGIHLPAVRRRGPADPRSVPRLWRPWPGPPRARPAGAHSRPGSTTARAFVWPAKATPGARGGPRGDLYIFISVRPHELFERDGLDLLCSMPVPMTTAALGGDIEAPCLLGGENCDGANKIRVKVPEGAQTGHTVRLRGKGMPSLRSRERGDLVVELFIETPTHLNAKQKALMRELAGLCGEHQNPKSAKFFQKAKRFWEDVTGGEARV